MLKTSQRKLLTLLSTKIDLKEGSTHYYTIQWNILWNFWNFFPNLKLTETTAKFDRKKLFDKKLLLPKLNFSKWVWVLGIFSIGVCDTPTFFYIPFLYTFFYIQSTQQCQWEKEKKILLFGFLNKNIIQFLQFLGEIRGYLKHIFGNCRYKGLNIKHWVWTFNGCGPR